MSGVSPELHYDPVGRVVQVDQPDGTQLTTEHTPWRSRSWNEADNIPDQTGTPPAYGWYDATPDGGDWDIAGNARIFDVPGSEKVMVGADAYGNAAIPTAVMTRLTMRSRGISSFMAWTNSLLAPG